MKRLSRRSQHVVGASAYVVSSRTTHCSEVRQVRRRMTTKDRLESDDKNAYRPRHPEDSLLYRTIADHLETFLARQQERGREVPYFVEREMREYLSCGVLACGFLRLVCESCGKDRLLPLSCKS